MTFNLPAGRLVHWLRAYLRREYGAEVLGWEPTAQGGVYVLVREAATGREFRLQLGRDEIAHASEAE
jgi:hypothetical protein